VLCENIRITRHKNIHIDVHCLFDLTKDFTDLIVLFQVPGIILASGMNINILNGIKTTLLKMLMSISEGL